MNDLKQQFNSVKQPQWRDYCSKTMSGKHMWAGYESQWHTSRGDVYVNKCLACGIINDLDKDVSSYGIINDLEKEV